MDVFEAMQGLNQTTKFKPDAIDDKLIGVMLYMATQATSAGNLQEWRFVVVKDEEKKNKLFDAALKQNQVKHAPVDIVVCADLKVIFSKYQKRGEVLYALQDTAAAVQNLMLAAKGLGLGTYWTRAFDEDGVKNLLDLPDNVRPLAIVAVGQPEGVEKLDRFDFEGSTWVNTWGEKYDVSYFVQEPGVHRQPKPLGNMIENAFKKKSRKKSIDFSGFLKKLSK